MGLAVCSQHLPVLLESLQILRRVEGAPDEQLEPLQGVCMTRRYGWQAQRGDCIRERQEPAWFAVKSSYVSA